MCMQKFINIYYCISKIFGEKSHGRTDVKTVYPPYQRTNIAGERVLTGSIMAADHYAEDHIHTDM